MKLLLNLGWSKKRFRYQKQYQEFNNFTEKVEAPLVILSVRDSSKPNTWRAMIGCKNQPPLKYGTYLQLTFCIVCEQWFRNCRSVIKYALVRFVVNLQ